MPRGTLLEGMPFWNRFLYESLCIEVLEAKHQTEPVVRVAIAIVVVEVEQTGIGIIVIASTFEEWIASRREVRVHATA